MGHASEAGLSGHSVKLIAVRKCPVYRNDTSLVIRRVEENLEVVNEVKSFGQRIENNYGRERMSIATSVG